MAELTVFKASFAEPGEMLTFNVSKEVAILGVSLYVAGIGRSPIGITTGCV
jgi:hypothetical protein